MSVDAASDSPHAARPFYVVSGTLPLESQSYVARQADKDLLAALLAGEYCFVLNSRQMGKSSLAVRTMAKLKEAGARTVFLDLTKFGGSNTTPEQWYIGLLSETGRALGLRKELLEYWKENTEYSLIQRYIGALHDIALAQIASPLVLFIDEIDAVKSLPFSTDEFFSAIRECYNRRAHEPEYGRIVFALIGSATASDLIQDTRTSPFNIGKRIELKDFTLDECKPLAEGITGPIRPIGPNSDGQRILERVFYWTNGHPFLTQALCAEIARATSVPTPNTARSANTGSMPDTARSANAGSMPDTARSANTGSTPGTARSANTQHLTPVLVDRLVATMFFEAKARERDVNLADVSNRVLSSYLDPGHKEEHRAAILDLYGKVLNRRARVPDDETNRLVAVLKLSGITASVDGELRVRNRIYEHVFDRAWIERNMPDAELRRQKAAYRRGMLRTAAVSAAVLAVDTVLAGLAFRGWRKADDKTAEADKERDEAQHLLYIANMNRIGPAYEQNDLGRVQTLLEETKNSKYRGIEWHYWNRLCHLEHLAFSAPHGHVFRDAAFSPNGKLIITTTTAKSDPVELWDAVTGKRILAIQNQSGFVRSTVFSPDGSQFATGSTDKNVRIWDSVTGKQVRKFDGLCGAISHVAYSPDGAHIATVGHLDDNTARVLDAESGYQISTLKGHTAQINSLSWGWGGKRIATASYDGTARLWDSLAGRQITILLKVKTTGEEVYDVAFSRDGTKIVTGSGDNVAQMWNGSNGRLIQTLKMGQETGDVDSVAFSPDGKRIVTGSRDRIVRIWDASSGLVIQALKGNTRDVWDAAFSPDGKRVLARDVDCCKVWDLASYREALALTGHRGSVTSARFSPDGMHIATGGFDGTLRVWDSNTGRAIGVSRPHNGPVATAAFSPDGKRLVTGCGVPDRPANIDRIALVWDAATGRQVLALAGHTSGITSATFSPDGKKIATGSADNTARVWDSASGRRLFTLVGRANTAITSRPFIDKVYSVAFSADGTRIASTSSDGICRVWDAATGVQIRELYGHGKNMNYCYSAAFSPEGSRVVTSHADHTAKIWDAINGHLMLTLVGHSDQVISATFSPDGKRIVTGSSDDTARIWEAETGKEVLTLRGHQSWVNSVSFSPDGKRAVTASGDGTARVWYFDDTKIQQDK